MLIMAVKGVATLLNRKSVDEVCSNSLLGLLFRLQITQLPDACG